MIKKHEIILILDMPNKNRKNKRKEYEFDYSFLYTNKNMKIIKVIEKRLKEIDMKKTELMGELGYSSISNLTSLKLDFKEIVKIESILKLHIINPS